MCASTTNQHSLHHIYTTLCSFGCPKGKTSTIWHRLSRGYPESRARALGLCGMLTDLGLVSLQMGWQSQQSISAAMELTSWPRCAVGRGVHWNEKLSLSMRTNFPHGDRLAVGQVTQKRCAVSLVSWTFSKSECIEPWAICQTTLRRRLG